MGKNMFCYLAIFIVCIKECEKNIYAEINQKKFKPEQIQLMNIL